MHLEFLVEEPSLKEALTHFLPKFLSQEISFEIHAFRGKQDLLNKLPGRLKGYKSWLPNDYKIVILIDEDRQDCRELKQKLEDMAIGAGFTTKSSSSSEEAYQVLNRIVIEELESWFFGDVNAICQAYPKVSRNLANQSRYRDPDAIIGGTWEALERVLKKASYFQGGLEKLTIAREISQYMNPSENRSRSFQVFVNGLLEISAP